MRIGVLFFLGACVAALLLSVSPGAVAGSDQPVVVAVGVIGSQQVLNYETLDGVILRSRPVPWSMGTFVPAANGAVVFMAAQTPNTSLGAIWLMRPDGTAIELDSSSDDFDPSISYDGSKVVFERFDPTSGTSDIYVVNADGTGLRLVASGADSNLLDTPTFSPDGGSIAYWCGPAEFSTDTLSQGCGPLTDGSYRNSGVMRVDADGSNPRMILIGAGEANEPGGPGALSWSPNGQWIVLGGLSDTPGKYGNLHELFAYHTDGSDLFNNDDPTRQVTHETNPWGAFDGQFCGNSTQILFTTVVDDHGNSGDFSYEINLDGTDRREIFLSTADSSTAWGICVLPSSGEAPPPLVDATHVTVPSVHELGLGAAKSKLKAHNLSLGKVTYKASSAVHKNRVLDQYPRAGAVAHRTRKNGPRVNLVVSRGRHRRSQAKRG